MIARFARRRADAAQIYQRLVAALHNNLTRACLYIYQLTRTIKTAKCVIDDCARYAAKAMIFIRRYLMSRRD